MGISVLNHKGLLTGLIYVASGLAALVLSRSYSFGTPGRMGPGYFPTVIASLLIVVGILAVIRSLRTQGAPTGPWAWRALALVLSSVVLFGLLLERAGLLVASVVLLVTSAAASREFRFDWRVTLGLVALVAACATVFVKGLGVPMPLIGSWFGTLAGH